MTVDDAPPAEQADTLRALERRLTEVLAVGPPRRTAWVWIRERTSYLLSISLEKERYFCIKHQSVL